MTTPTNNEKYPNYCDACHTRINIHDECACLNNGGFGWAVFHTDEDTEGGE